MDFIMQGLEFFHKGGFVMYILLLCSIFVVTIAVERAMYFHRADSGRRFAREFYLLLANGKTAEARNMAHTASGILACSFLICCFTGLRCLGVLFLTLFAG